MKIDELTQAQKEIFCRAMAGCGFYEETESAYSNALHFFGIEEPDDGEFSYVDGLGAELYQEVEDAMTKAMYLRLIFVAIYDAGNFDSFAPENRGYEFAISMLNDLESISSEEEFIKFVDLVADA